MQLREKENPKDATKHQGFNINFLHTQELLHLHQAEACSFFSCNKFILYYRGYPSMLIKCFIKICHYALITDYCHLKTNTMSQTAKTTFRLEILFSWCKSNNTHLKVPYSKQVLNFCRFNVKIPSWKHLCNALELRSFDA